MLNFPHLLLDLWFGTRKHYYGSKSQIYNKIYSEASHPLHPLYPVIISLFFPLSVNNQFISFQLIFPYVHMSRHMYIFLTWTVCVCLATRSCPTLCNPWTVARQAPLFMGFSRQGYRSGLPFPSPGDFPDPAIGPGFPALQAGSLPSEPPGKPTWTVTLTNSPHAGLNQSVFLPAMFEGTFFHTAWPSGLWSCAYFLTNPGNWQMLC